MFPLLRVLCFLELLPGKLSRQKHKDQRFSALEKLALLIY